MDLKNFKLNKDVILANLLGRKFIYCVFATLLITLLVCCTVISETVFENIFTVIIIAFIGGNLAEKYSPKAKQVATSSAAVQHKEDVNMTATD